MLANEGAHRLPCSAGNSPSTVTFITCTKAPSRSAARSGSHPLPQITFITFQVLSSEGSSKAM